MRASFFHDGYLDRGTRRLINCNKHPARSRRQPSDICGYGATNATVIIG